MTDEQDYEDYQNTLNEIVDGGGCVETMTAASDLRGEGEETSRRDLLESDALAGGVADSVVGVLAEVDTEEARAALKADYEDLDDVREAVRETVDPAVFEALADDGIDLTLGDLELDPAVCLKTFTEGGLDAALTLLPHIHEDGVVGRIVARTTVDGTSVTVHAIPEWDRSYAVVAEDDADRLVLPDGASVDCTEAEEGPTGVDCDPDRSARTEYVQTTLSVGGTEYVIETTCSMV